MLVTSKTGSLFHFGWLDDREGLAKISYQVKLEEQIRPRKVKIRWGRKRLEKR